MMKNRIFLWSVLFMLLLSISICWAATELRVEPSEKTVVKDETFSISVHIDTDDSINGGDMAIRYDPLVIAAINEQAGAFFTDPNDFSEINNTEGKIVFSIFEGNGTVGLNGSDSLIDITFKALVKNGASSIEIEDPAFYDNNEIPNVYNASNIMGIANGAVNAVTVENVVINEFLSNPSAGNDWVEVYNNDSKGIDLSGWRVNDSAGNDELIGDVSIAVGAHVLVDMGNRLNKDGDTILLINDEGTIIDESTYSADIGKDNSSGRMHDGLGSWIVFDGALEQPTPDAANNRLPVGDIGDKLVDEDESGYFIITDEISDPDGDDLIFTVVDENQVSCDIIDYVNVTLVPAADWSGIANCTIEVDDGYGIVDKVFNINVGNINDRPYFDPALEDKTVNEDSTLTYDINASDDDVGDELSFASNITLVGGMIDAATGVLTWTPDNDDIGGYNIGVTVCDNSGAANDCANDSFVITVSNTNDQPYFDFALEDKTVNEDSTLTYDINASDDDVGDELSFASNITLVGGMIDAATGILTWTPDNSNIGEYYIYVEVCDDSFAANDCANDSFVIRVGNTNDDPVLASVEDKTVIENLLLTFTLNAIDEDPTNDTLVFETNASLGNFNLDSDTGEITFTPTYADVGVYDVLFKVTDGNGGEDSEIIRLEVLPVLDIIDIKLNGVSVEDGDIVGGIAPGDTINVQYKLKNRLDANPNNAVVGIETGAAINAYLLAQSNGGIILEGQETEMVEFDFQLPYTANIQDFNVEIGAQGVDLFENIYYSSKIINLILDRDFHRVEITKKEWLKESLTCARDTQLLITLVNTGNWSEQGVVSVYNEKTDTNETKTFALGVAKDIVLSFDVDGAAAAINEVFSITLKYYENYYITQDSIGLVIGNCLDVESLNAILKVNESEMPTWSLIDLRQYTYDNTTGLSYAIVGENIGLIDCNVTNDGMFSCGTPIDDLYGISVINMSIGDVYEEFNVDVLSKNDAPVAYGVSEEVDEDGSAVIKLNCSDADGDLLGYAIVGEPDNGLLSGSGDLRTYKPNKDYNGADSFTYKCNDGDLDSNIATVDIEVRSVLDPPSIVSVSPDYDPLIGDNVDQNFNVTVDNPDGILILISWYVDGSKDGTGTTYTFNEATAKAYGVIVKVTNAAETETYDEEDWVVTVSDVPVTNKFTGTILNVEPSNVGAFTGLTIMNSFGMIDFGNQTINLEDVVNVDANVRIENGIVGINFDAFGFDVFRIPATITMYGLSVASAPTIYYNAGFTVTGGNKCTSSTDPACTNMEYNAIEGTLRFDVSHFTMFFLNMPPTITSSPITSAIVGEEYRYDVEANDPESSPLVYSLTAKPTGMSIDSNNGVITWTPIGVGEENVTVSVTDSVNTVTQSFSIDVEEGAKLRISDLDIDVGDETEKDVNNGDTIGEEARPGYKVKFDIEIENLFSSSSDIKIENIEVVVTIEDIDDGDDLEEEDEIDEIDAGKDEKVSLEFRIPTLVKEDTYDVIIDIDGEDENGKDHQVRWELKLEVKKDKHELLIDELDLTPSVIECNRNPSLSLEVVNIGREDEDDVRVEIRNSELGLNIETRDIELEEGDNDDAVFERTYTLEIGDDVKAGTYPITVKAYYDSKVGDEERVDLIVKKCAKIITSVETEEPVEVIKTTDKITVPVKPPVTKISFRETSGYLTLLTILFMVLLGGLIFLAGAAIILRRER